MHGDLIHADNINLKFGDVTVLRNVGFVIPQGAFVSILGPNGAGKTQLLRIMLGLLQPSSGSITRHFTMREVGYVPQRLAVDPTFPITVHEFLQMYLQTTGWWIHGSLPAFDDMFAVTELLSKRIGKLSGGQLQRVLLAGVLSTKPKVLFLDEFSSGIDPRGQAELYNYLHRLNEQSGVTIVMVSHDVDVTAQYADVVLCLNKELICTGRPQDIFTHENFQKMYGIPLTKVDQHHHDD
ncbi:MAG: High-affinity zinc uptake system ATP-binding protein [uncultured bacterium]|nr:MAG: High-affinity zinc uptake system ATP-binding protein [uncultured bacterium]HBY73180.1 zinc ABC transporter ATP-binding protein ZnuC [Candidatus Kerfeldbacteria bacterium]